MKNIEKLTILDLKILEKVKEVNNLGIPLLESEIPFMYNELFKEYSTDNNLESLKRAIFIQWYSVSEPCEYTGINITNLEYQKNNILKVRELIQRKNIDLEFSQMLLHYNNITDWYFNLYLTPLFCIESKSEFNISIKGERGIMGKYWKSILNNKSS